MKINDNVSFRNYKRDQASVRLTEFISKMFYALKKNRTEYTLFVTRNDSDIPLMFGDIRLKYDLGYLKLFDISGDSYTKEMKVLHIIRGKADHEYSSWRWIASLNRVYKVKVYNEVKSLVDSTRMLLGGLPTPNSHQESIDSFGESLLYIIEKMSQNQYKVLVKALFKSIKYPTLPNMVSTWNIINSVIQFEADIEDTEDNFFLSPIRIIHNQNVKNKSVFNSSRVRSITGKW